MFSVGQFGLALLQISLRHFNVGDGLIQAGTDIVAFQASD